MAFDVAGARAAGYSDEEIASFLGEKNGFDSGAALKAGYTPAEIIDHLSVTRQAGGGRGFVNPPEAADVQGNRMREMQNANLNAIQKGKLASAWTQQEIARLQELNPNASMEDLVALADMAYEKAKTATPDAPTDRVRQYVDKGMSIQDARANARFDEGVQRKLNRTAQTAAPDERGDRVSVGYNPNTEAERVAAQTQELADARQAVIDRNIAEEMNPVLRGLTKGGFQSVGLTGGTVGFLGDAFGSEALKKWGLDVYDKNTKIANALTLSKGASDISSIDDFQTWLAENSGYVAYQAAEAILSGGLGSAVGKQIGKKAAVEAVALGLNNLRQTLGAVYADAVTDAKRNGTEPPSLLQIAGGAVMSAAIDTVADKLGLDAITARGFKGNFVSRLGKSTALQMGVQGGTEAAQLVPEEWGAGRNPFREGMGKQFFDEAAVGALGGIGPGAVGSLQRYQEPPAPVPTAAEIARDKGFLVDTPAAPRVQDQPTIPTVPQTPAKPAANPDPITGVNDNALLGAIPVEGQNEAAQANQGAAEAPAAAAVQPAAAGVAAAAAATDAVQPALVAPGAPTGTSAVKQDGSVIPGGYDPISKLQQELADLKARTEKAIAEKKAAEEKAAAEAAAATAANGQNYRQVSATPTPQSGAVPSPALETRMVQRAIASYQKNQDLTNQNIFPERVLYGIINAPDTGPELLSAARSELERRRGTATQPTVSYNAQLQPGATSLGVDSPSQRTVRGAQPVDQGGRAPAFAQTGSGQPGLLAGAVTVGSDSPAQSHGGLVLAATAPQGQLLANQLAVKRAKGIVVQPVQEGTQLTEEQALASALAHKLGKTVTWVEQSSGAKDDMPDGWVNRMAGDHIFMDINSSKPLLEIVMHEGTHALPTHIRTKLRDFVNSKVSQQGRAAFLAKYKYAGENKLTQDEEVLAYVAQLVTRRPEFITDLKNALGNKDFAEFARILLSKMQQWLGRGDSAFDSTFLKDHVADLQQVHDALVQAYTQAMREQGLQPDAGLTAPVFAQRRTQNTETVGEHDVTPAKDGSIFVHGDPEAIRAKIPEGVKGRVEEGGIRFTHSDAPRVRGALGGNQIAYSRGGQVNEKLAMTKDGKYIGAPEKFNTPGKIPTLRKWLRKLAEEGAPGRYWYENSSAAILHMTGGDVQEARKFVALLAIYSPQAKVDANSTFALRAWSQYKMGQPISVKTGVMDRKAKAAMDDVDAFWSGEKTGNFFTNLLSEIDPSTKGKQGATIDMWMMRAGQYDNDAPTKTQYAFMENETNRLARELGWEPQQVQAAIWVAMKARMENTGVKKRTEAISEKKGWMRYDYPLKNGKPRKTRVVLDAQKHRDNWLDQAFKHDPTKDDTEQAKFDFSDGVRRHIGQVSWEARPGRSTGVLPGVNDAPYAQQVEFQQAVQKALLGPNGEDLLAQQLGLLVDGEDLLAPGVWQGEIAAGMQKPVAMAPAKGDEGKTGLDSTQKEALDVYAAVLGLLLRQEGVGWHRPFYGSSLAKANGVELRIGSPFTPEQAKELWAGLDAAMRSEGVADWEQSAGLISSPQGMRVVNFGALEDNKDFQRLVESVADGLSFEADFGVFTSDGNLVSNDWKEQPNGDSYKSGVIAAGRSDLLGWAGSVLAPRVQQVFNDFSERYNWGDPGQPVFSNRAGDGLGSVYEERGPSARPHAVRIDGTHFSKNTRTSLDGRYFGQGLKGAEQSRLAESTDPRIKERVYFYVDEGKGVTPEAGVGGVAHAATVGNLYNVQGDPLKLFKANDINGSESRVLDAGYDGYYFPNYVNGQGIAIVMGNASRGIKVEPTEYAKGQRQAEPEPPYKRGLMSRELNKLDLPALQAVAPSAKVNAGTLQLDRAELDAARAELAKQGIELPADGPVFSNKDLDQDITLDIPVEGGKTAKLTINAQSYLNQLDRREEALRMVKECMA